MMLQYTFGDFLLEQMKRRGLGVREFARLIGVSHATLIKFFDFGRKEVGFPSVEFIAKLAAATDTKVHTIMALLLPDLPQAVDSDEDPEALALAKQILELSPDDYKLIASYIRNAKIKVKGKPEAEDSEKP